MLQPRLLAQAPHRLYFFLGALALAVLFGWWFIGLRSGASSSVPLHALIMPLGVFPLFILGFTFTAGPRWLSVDASSHLFLLHGGTYFAGILILLLASSLHLMPLQLSGFALMLAAWSAVSLRWAKLIRQSQVKDKTHALILLIAMIGGIASLVACLFWVAGSHGAWQIARQLSFFAFLLPIFLSVCHRMLPFFTSNVLPNYSMWRPNALLWSWLGACYLIVLSNLLGFAWLEALTASALSLSFANTAWRWGLFRSVLEKDSNRLLAMLHLSFAWLSIVFALQAAGAWGAAVGSAPVHALALGFMGTMLVGFVSRVSFGHSGRPLKVNTLLWVIYLSLHAAALVRVAASLAQSNTLMHFAAAAWLCLLLAWVAMMLPIYLQARVDGQAG